MLGYRKPAHAWLSITSLCLVIDNQLMLGYR
jgi:hypothetical protein